MYGCVSGKNCCGACTILDDNFNREDSDDLGPSWVEVVDGFEIVGERLQGTGPCLMQSVLAAPDVTVESETYAASSKISIRWLPLENDLPSIHRIHLGEILTGETEVNEGIFLQVEAGEREGAPTIVARLGYREDATDNWLTDELPIGWADSGYTGEETAAPEDRYFDLTLCWTPGGYYGYYSYGRGSTDVIATIESYTGAYYTLEGTVLSSLNTRHAIIEQENNARWDDFRWIQTKPDNRKCPWCGSCLFAADMTTPADQGTAAYSSSGGSFHRDGTTGGLELTGATANWLVSVPAKNALTLTYEADWSGSSPVLTVENGRIKVVISKAMGQQYVVVYADGDADGGTYIPLESDELRMCFANRSALVNSAGGPKVYETEENAGYTTITFTASGSAVSLKELQVKRTDNDAVTKYRCDPCDLTPTTVCMVCEEDPFELAPYGSAIVTGSIQIEAFSRVLFDGSNPSWPGAWVSGPGTPCVQTAIIGGIPRMFTTQVTKCPSIESFPGEIVVEKMPSWGSMFNTTLGYYVNPTWFAPGGGVASAPTMSINWYQCNIMRYFDVPCNTPLSCSGHVFSHFAEFITYSNPTDRLFCIRGYIWPLWAVTTVPFYPPGTCGPPFVSSLIRMVYNCVGGVLEAAPIADLYEISPGVVVPGYGIDSTPIYDSGYIDYCDRRTTFTLDRIGPAVKEGLFATTTYPDTLSITLLR